MMLVIKLMIYLVVIVVIKRTITKTHLQVAVAAVAAIAAAAVVAAIAATKSNLWFSPKKLRFLNGTISAVKKQAL